MQDCTDGAPSSQEDAEGRASRPDLTARGGLLGTLQARAAQLSLGACSVALLWPLTAKARDTKPQLPGLWFLLMVATWFWWPQGHLLRNSIGAGFWRPPHANRVPRDIHVSNT